MTTLKQPVEVRIGRVSSGSVDDGYIALEITDPISGIQFLTVNIPFARFGSMVVNGPSSHCEAELRGLEYIGMKRVMERRQIIAPDVPSDVYPKSRFYSKWLEENAQEEGWLVNTYLGSQGSIQTDYRTGVTTLHYGVTKFVPVTTEE